jgi:putative endonuclease
MLNLFQHPWRGIACIMQRRNPCTYILASQTRGTLYIGVTSNLTARIWQHRSGEMPGFTARYRVHRLVHAEFFETMDGAITREKQLKQWHRAWKINLIEEGNPEWKDLAVTWGLAEPLRRGP